MFKHLGLPAGPALFVLVAVALVTAITWLTAAPVFNISLDSQPGWALSLVP